MMLLHVVVTSIALLLVAGDWVLGAFLAWPLWLRIVITLVVLLLLAVYFLVVILRQRSKARALEADILRQAEQQAMAARPDRRAEILELQLKVKRALEALKTSKLGNKRGGPLYALPWYMIVGPPGAGKTTALQHSGLSFPVLDAQGGIRGIGGTRNCDWWFTNEGILIDTAGRYTIENEDTQEWTAFLDMVKKYRSRMPLNGLLVAVSVPELVEASEEEVVAKARRVRSRVDEIMTRLRMVLPVYVMFTKADLISGFSEFFDDLRKSERAQIWGFTLPLAARNVEPRKGFDEEFDQLARSVFARAIRRLGAERHPEARAKIFHFPLEFRNIKQNLVEFVGTLFERNSFQDTPTLRGVYFSSGTQEGRPIDRVLGSMMRAFDIAPPMTAEPRKEPKSYFVQDMFRKVVFPDQDVAARSEGERRRQIMLRGLLVAAALGLGALLVGPSACTFMNNRELLRHTEDVAAEASRVKWLDGGNVVEKVKRLDDMREELKQLEGWKADDPPLSYRWGMYVGNDVYIPLRNLYLSNLKAAFVDPTKAKLEEELKAVQDTGALTPEQYNVYFNRLKAYLEGCQAERLDVDWESNALTEAWSRALNTAQKADKDVLRPHATYYVDLTKKGEVKLWDCDMTLATRIRAYLKRLSVADRDYSSLVRDANEYVPPITRETIFLNTAFGAYITSKSSPEVVVLGAYTKAGWDLYIRDRFGKDRIKQLIRDRWVLGESEDISVERTEKQMKELQDRYFANFTRAWADFMKDLDVRVPQSNDEALQELSALSEIPWPYMRLIRTLDENTRLEESLEERLKKEMEAKAKNDAMNIAAQAIQGASIGGVNVGQGLPDAGAFIKMPPPVARWISPPEQQFKPIVELGITGDPNADLSKPTGTKLGHYQERIVSKVVAIITDLRDSKGKGVKPEAVTLAFEEAIRGTNELLNPGQSAFTRPLISPLLLNPLELGYHGVQNDLINGAGGSWEQDVWKKWRASLEDGYPFTDTLRDVKLSDYSMFFKPGTGLLFKFYDLNLKQQLDLTGKHYVPSTRFGQTGGFTGPFLKCLDRGLEISEATFDDKADAPAVEFEINLHSVSENVSEVTIEIDGQSKTYKNGPEEWLSVKWPQPTAKDRGSRVKIRGYSGLNEEIIRPGEWSWFRVLDAAKSIEKDTSSASKAGPPGLVATWNLRSQPGYFKLDIKPLRDDNPFNAYLTRKERLFRGYVCPRVIAAGPK